MRVWSAIKAKFKKEKIDELRWALINFKSTLLVAHQVAFYQSINGRFDKQQQAILSMTQVMEDMELGQSSQTVAIPVDSGSAGLAAALKREVERMASKEGNPIIRSGFEMAMAKAIQQMFPLNPEGKMHNITPLGITDSGGCLRSQTSRYGFSTKKRHRDRMLSHRLDTEINVLFGKISFSSQTFQMLSNEGEPTPDGDLQEETEIAFRFHPASWIVNLGFLYGLSAHAIQSGQNWKHVMKTFRPVPDNSQIFEFCKLGDINGVKSLLSQRRASPWDTNSTGWTPLHVAAQSVHPELCSLLIAADADRSARPYKYSYSCLSLATEKDSNYSVTKTRDTLRIFLDEADDFHDGFGDGWTTLFSLVELELKGTHSFDEHQSAFAWLIKITQHNIRAGTHLSGYSSMYSLLQSSIESGILESFEFILNTFSNFIDIRNSDHEITLLVECLKHREYAMARSLIQRGANLHAEGYDYDCEIVICPTYHALFSSESFFEWRELLKAESVDLEDFIASVIKQTSFSRDGWRKDTLQKLFDLDFEPTPQPILHKCANFDSFEDCVNIFVELSWKRLLDRIILGGDTVGVFQGYPKSKEPGRAFSQRDIEKRLDSNHEEVRSVFRCEVNTPILETDLMHTCTKLEDLVDDEASGWLCVACWQRMLPYADGSEADTSSSYEYLADQEDSDEEDSEEEFDEEDSPFLFSM
ncbi:hypothetical protein BDZ45DRAFT_323096 [Acephala macrosclerotiorum]|nr:hypothetical protein BDZ45DRAFT_323096 [Acephala macrosclerotiorum]